MKLNIPTFYKLAKRYLKYQFALYPMKFNVEPELQERSKVANTSDNCGVCGFASLHPKGALRSPFTNPGAPLGDIG